MATMTLFIEPVDVWLFRDNKPFDAGSDHRAVSLFPPTPQTMAGVIRSHHLVMQNIDLRKPADKTKYAKFKSLIETMVGTALTPPGSFQMRGPIISRQIGNDIVRYYPLPADAVRQQGVFKALRPKPKHIDGPRTNLPDQLQILWLQDQSREKQPVVSGGYWLAEPDLQAYLYHGEVSITRTVQGNALFETEARMGVGIVNAHQTADEGLLYQVGYVRLQAGVGLMVEFGGLCDESGNLAGQWPELQGSLSIGGEARAGTYRHLKSGEYDQWPEPDQTIDSRFKLYFTTPTCFDEGWKPSCWDTWFEGEPKLVGVSIGRPLILGGYDLANNAHKAANRYVPPGSVYFFEGQPKLKSKVKTIADVGSELGFGQFMIGRW